MYKCLVCDKPVTVPSALETNGLHSSTTQYVTRYDSDAEDSRSTILHSPIKKMNCPNLMATTAAAAAAPSPIRPLTHQQASSSDLPLPPVIASPGV
jgi:hypothetical protein